MTASATNTASVIHELPLMRVLQAPPLSPVFLLEDWEIGKTQPLPSVSKLPWAMFIDDQLRVHFEINHALTNPSPTWREFLHPEERYGSFARKFIEKSFLRNERRLIGVCTVTYLRDQRCAAVEVVAIIRPEDLPDIAPEVRKQAYIVLAKRLDEFNQWLGADYAHSGNTVIPPHRMKKIGWEECRIRKIRNLIRFYYHGFPMWLRVRQRLFIRRYRCVPVI